MKSIDDLFTAAHNEANRLDLLLSQAGFTTDCSIRQALANSKSMFRSAEKAALLKLESEQRALDWYGKQIEGCGQYTKDGETIAQAMERHWKDSQYALGLFAKERIKCEKLEGRISA